MPPPPPPPPGPPPPPAPPLAAAPSAAVDPKNRNLLLQSIRQGTTLKKTVTKDRSAPLIAGKPNGGKAPRWESQDNKQNIKCATIARSNGLAGLFADGMPKLKPTGVNLGQLPSNSLSSLPVSNHSALHNNTSTVKSEFTRRTVDTKNRGPPPQPPPPPNQKPVFPTSASDSTLTLTPNSHTRSVSNVSLQNGGKSGKPSVKPLLAPKPPAPAPPRKLPGRTQSMRAPASPPVLPPTISAPVFPTSTSELNRIQPPFHLSTDSLLRMRPRPPLRPPLSRPPPPPRSNPPPPPPPSQPPPPPPPHRTSPTVINRIAPPLPVGIPPQPPHRHSSIRNGSMTNINGDFETRFENMFHPVKDFPPPPPFMGVLKVYNSKTVLFAAKQQAPQPPGLTQPVLQLGPKMWTRDTSTC